MLLIEEKGKVGVIMQLTIVLVKDRITLPIATCETVQGLLYKAIAQDAPYALSLHDGGRIFDGRKFKLFSFGEPEGRYEIDGGNIVYLSRVRLTVRSADDYFIQLLLTYFTAGREVRLGNNTVTVGEVRLGDKRIYDGRIVIRTLSPITAYITEPDGHTLYFTPQDSRFYDCLIANARRKYVGVFGTEEGFSLRIAPAEHARFIKRATHFKTTLITAWHGQFVLEGPPQVLELLYNTGLGSKNSQGFGLFETKAAY